MRRQRDDISLREGGREFHRWMVERKKNLKLIRFGRK